jgi:hypothetical protein
MSREPLYEKFDVAEAAGAIRHVEFVRSAFLAQGDQPELFFFLVNNEETVVGISGASLNRFQQGRPRLTREEKIDIAGQWLKRQIEAGMPLDSRHLHIRDYELAYLANELDLSQ